MTEVEPEWDDRQRDLMAELAAYEAGVCDCGFHESLSTDTANIFEPVVKKCPLCASLAVRERVQDDREHKAIEDKGPDFPRPSDGRRTLLWLKGRKGD